MTVENKQVHVSEEKKTLVSEYAKLIKEYPVIGAVDVEKLPAKQFMVMRRKLQGKAKILMGKKRLISKAFDQAGLEKADEFKSYLTGMPALLFSHDNPFTLYKILKQSKSPAPIKGGDVAPKDIIVPAGPTEFSPGPIIGELGGIGIKSGVENGKVAIKEDSKVASQGDVVSEKVAGILQRLGIQPMEIGLNVQAVHESGSIIQKSILDIDEQEYIDNIKLAAADSYKLAISQSITNEETMSALLMNAYSDAVKLADSQTILTDDNIKDMIAKAERQALSVNKKQE